MKRAYSFLLATCIALLICLPQGAYAYHYQGPEAELICLINAERVKNGAAPLTQNWEVARVARYKSEEMKRHGMLCHESLVYGSPAQQLTRFNVPHSVVGANIAMGHETPRLVLDAWLNSQNHYANLIDDKYTSAGVGLSIDDDGIFYWTLMLVKDS